MKHLLLVSHLLFTFSCLAQVDRLYDFADSLIARNPQAPYQDLVNIGEYEAALKLSDKSYPPGYSSTHTYTADELERIRLCNARGAILANTANKQVVMINEGHHNPNTRIFTASLLKDLYTQGYRYFGAEGLTYGDTLLNKRGFPIQKTLSYAEPEYGELIRTALKTGFTVFAYEAQEKFFRSYDSLSYKITEWKSETSGEIQRGMIDTVTGIYYMVSNGREKDQAANIYRIIQHDPTAKVVVHCGYGHLTETGSYMGGEFIKQSHIDPLTIDQILLQEHVDLPNDSIYQKFGINHPTVLCDSAGYKIMPASWSYGQTDWRVIHPLTRYLSSRPDWLNYEGNKKKVFVKEYLKGIKLPVIVTCFYQNEYDLVGLDAIPVDAIQLTKENIEKPLLLKPGKYLLRIRSAKKVELVKSIVVE